MSDTPTIGDDNLEFLSDPVAHKETLRLYRLENLRADHAEVRCADLECELAVVREQRDRAMRLIGNAKPAWNDSERKDEWFHQENVLMAEIAKEKEAK